MKKYITVSAPGKLMIMGEHSVVYQKPCLVTAVDSRMTAEFTVNTDNVIRIDAQEFGLSNYQRPVVEFRGIDKLPKEVQFVEVALQMMYSRFELKQGVNIKTSNGFSSKYGLGSSSAVNVCTVKAISELFDLKLSNKDLFDIAYQATLEIQGVGSGFDIAAAIWGGTLYFVGGGSVIEPLLSESLPCVTAYSGVKADTPTIVKALANRREENQEAIDGIFEEITDLVEQGKLALLKKDWSWLGRSMNKNQKLLQDLGVSTDMLHKLCVSSLLAGAHGAKLSGAGGGDCMIALIEERDRRVVTAALEEAGGTIVPVTMGAEGVRVEQ